MNSLQKKIVFVGVGLLLACLLFPPAVWAWPDDLSRARLFQAELPFRFIFSTDRVYKTDTTQLAIRVVVIAVITLLSVMAARERKS